MPDWNYSEDELARYFSDADQRKAKSGGGASAFGSGDGFRPGGASASGSTPGSPPRRGSGWFDRKFPDPHKAQGARALAVVAGAGLLVFLLLFGYVLLLLDESRPPSSRVRCR